MNSHDATATRILATAARILIRLFAPLAPLYKTIVRLRAELYRRGVLQVHALAPATVISVGNITVGGTGKTPLVRLIARLAHEETRADSRTPRVCILSRGYRRTSAERVIVSDGTNIFADARTGGDEPRELAEALLGTAAVISDADRVAAGAWARQHLGSRVLILDDGFQHLRLARDLNVAVVDATDPFGGNHTLPRGRLREPPDALRRADLIVLTRTEDAADIDRIERQITEFSNGKLMLRAHTRSRTVRPLDISCAPNNQALHDQLDSARPTAPIFDAIPLRASPALAFGALGNPRAFFSFLRSDGWNLVNTLAFPDHHAYAQADAARICAEARRCAAALLVTTAKDAVKLRGLLWDVPCYVLEIEFVLDDEATLRRLIRKAIAGAGRRRKRLREG